MLLLLRELHKYEKSFKILEINFQSYYKARATQSQKARKKETNDRNLLQ